jgi:hypothetical protein
MESTLTDVTSSTPADTSSSTSADVATLPAWRSLLHLGATTVHPAPADLGTDEQLSSAFMAQMDDPGLVLSPGYIGSDRRATGWRAKLARVTYRQRRSILSLEFVVVAVVAVALITAVAVTHGDSHPAPVASVVPNLTTAPGRSAAATRAPVPTTVAPTTTVPAPTATTVPAPTTTAPRVAPAVAPAVSPTVSPATAPPTTVPVAPAAGTPDQLGAEALALVRYPWQNIPGYSIQFLPIADAPSPGFYGNTTFTWGHAGGTSILYVYSGETVDTLAGIIAFEIGHEVDAAAVEPQGGETQVENILGIHPASWAPDCDCAEQGFLSGWYAAAFSNYWSPGVGQWSQIAPEPSGAVLAAVQPWLNPAIP